MGKLIQRRVPLGSYVIPTEVLDLERDIVRLELIERILGQIEPRSIGVDQEGGDLLKWNLVQSVKLCRKDAEKKRREFLRK